MKPETKRLRADVVVVGSGGAGLCAAAAAARAGADTLLVTKGKAGLANATAYAGGVFTVSPPAGVVTAAPPAGVLTPEDHYRQSLETGRGLADPELLRELCDRGTAALRELERDYGVRFAWGSHGCSVAPFGRPPLLGGVGLTAPLVEYLWRAGVRVVEDAAVTAVVREGPPRAAAPRSETVAEAAARPESVAEATARPGRPAEASARGEVLGVLGVAIGREPVILEIRAPAVVIATGGGGAIYGRTDNPPRMTGDGYALLWDAGAVLQDMEFVQFYPMGVAEPGCAPRVLDTRLLDHVRLTDENGAEPLAGKFAEWGIASGSEANLYARDRVAVTLSRHIARGHRLFLHTEEIRGAAVPPEIADFVRSCVPRSFDPFSRPIEAAPMQHYFCGGASFAKTGEALGPGRVPVPGLFACGETTGGVDGANRVGGNALTNIVVFGLAAGKSAARYAATKAGPGRAGSGACPAWNEAREELAGLVSGWYRAPRAGGSASAARPAALRDELRALCDRRLSPVRAAAGLTDALSRLGDLARQVSTLAVASPADLLLALEAGPALATATFVARSALARTESRAAHFREEYPHEDETWLRLVTLGPRRP